MRWLARLHDDPASFSLIETSAASAAFGGSGVRNVLLENLIIEKHGNPPQNASLRAIFGDSVEPHIATNFSLLQQAEWP
jgi:hypothetical protein